MTLIPTWWWLWRCHCDERYFLPARWFSVLHQYMSLWIVRFQQWGCATVWSKVIMQTPWATMSPLMDVMSLLIAKSGLWKEQIRGWHFPNSNTNMNWPDYEMCSAAVPIYRLSYLYIKHPHGPIGWAEHRSRTHDRHLSRGNFAWLWRIIVGMSIQTNAETWSETRSDLNTNPNKNPNTHTSTKTKGKCSGYFDHQHLQQLIQLFVCLATV